MCPTCALSYAARVGLRSNDSDPRHAQGESARVRPLLRPAAPAQGRVLSSAHCPHCQTRRFSRGVILIGALSKVLRLPLLQEFGRLRQNQRANLLRDGSQQRTTHSLTVAGGDDVGLHRVVRRVGGVPPEHRALVEGAHRAGAVVAADAEDDGALAARAQRWVRRGAWRAVQCVCERGREQRGAAACRGAAVQSCAAELRCRAALQSCAAELRCGAELWCRAVLPSCGAELWCRAAVPSCRAAVQSCACFFIGA